MRSSIRAATLSISCAPEGFDGMALRPLPLVLGGLILALQYPLWLGKGGWVRGWDIGRQVEAQRVVNAKLDARNQKLDAEVRDLKQGLEAVEERARYELGMIRQDEVFFQVLGDAPAGAPGGTERSPAAAPAAPPPRR